MLVSVIDSYASYVAARFQALNAQVTINGTTGPQQFGGVVTAQDWPQAPVIEGAAYLIVQKILPRGNSKVQRQYLFLCQWTWLLIGTDIAANQQALNRGDRYRTDMQIMQNLKEANFPGWCQKIDYSVSGVGVVSGTPSAFAGPPPSTEEWVFWDDLEFAPRQDNMKSGLLYNAAGVTLMGWEDMQSAPGTTYATTEGPQVTTA
jgi:hypothetical protein